MDGDAGHGGAFRGTLKNVYDDGQSHIFFCLLIS